MASSFVPSAFSSACRCRAWVRSGSADRYLGALVDLRGDRVRAREHLEAVVAMDCAARWPVWEAHSLHALGRHLVQFGSVGERARGSTLVAQAFEVARSLDMRTLIARCEATASAAGRDGRSAEALGAAERLTPREREVLELLAEGLTNTAIGECIHASQYTVANHVRSILAKTGCRNRTEATAWVHRHRLDGRCRWAAMWRATAIRRSRGSVLST